MHKALIIVAMILATGILAGCSGPKRYHEKPLGDPSGYQAHFPDLDSDGNDLVSWEEFKARFPDANRNVYAALDLNKDGAVDHDEWDQFKEAHGLKDH